MEDKRKRVKGVGGFFYLVGVQYKESGGRKSAVSNGIRGIAPVGGLRTRSPRN